MANIIVFFDAKDLDEMVRFITVYADKVKHVTYFDDFDGKVYRVFLK